MNSIVNAFFEGGIWMYMILAVALASHPLAVLGFIFGTGARPEQRQMVMLMGLALLFMDMLSVGLGVVGFTTGIEMLESALVGASPEAVEALRAEGERMAQLPLYFGLVGGVLPSIVGVFLIVQAGKLKAGQPEATTEDVDY